MAILKWCPYDSDFTPNKLDTRFKDWTAKEITAVCNVMKKRTHCSVLKPLKRNTRPLTVSADAALHLFED